MCGRFTLTATLAEITTHFALHNTAVIKPRYNIAPDQVIPVIRTPGQIEFLHWGLRPHWLPTTQNGFINARAETVASKPSFRNAFKSRRCLVIADGYFEWKVVGKVKQPYYISLSGRELFGMAAIWEDDTCAIITTNGGKPLIVAACDYKEWLAQDTKIDVLLKLLTKEISEDFTIYPVSTTVNNRQHDFAECIQSLQ